MIKPRSLSQLFCAYNVNLLIYAIATDYSCSWPIAIKDLILTFTIYDEN